MEHFPDLAPNSAWLDPNRVGVLEEVYVFKYMYASTMERVTAPPRRFQPRDRAVPEIKGNV